jgi:alanine-glyoxylate transaminase/serine-glyoxylate transaminase/serine-pyruvate transaminase
MIVNYWEGAKRAYHHTAPINMIYGLYAALDRIINEGPENVFARHKSAHHQLVSGLESMGLEMLVPDGSRLPMLNAIRVPESVNEADVRSRLLIEHRIEIGAGLGPLAGKIWRIGLMGINAQPSVVDRILNALQQVLSKRQRS